MNTFLIMDIIIHSPTVYSVSNFITLSYSFLKLALKKAVVLGPIKAVNEYFVTLVIFME